MTNLSYSGDNSFKSEENIKDNLFKIFIIYSLLSIIILSLLNLTGVRLFNSLNMTMTLVSGGGFLPTESIDKIIYFLKPKDTIIIESTCPPGTTKK